MDYLVFDMKNYWRILFYSLLLSPLISCGGSSSSSPVPTLPNPVEPTPYSYQMPINKNDGWQVAHLDDANIKKTFLSSMMTAIQNETYVRIDSVQIVRNNKLIFDELIRTSLGGHDRYIGNTDLRVHSMQSTTKSFVSALVGIAIDRGDINSVDDKFYDFFTEYNDFDNWDIRKTQVSLKNVLTMQHGWEWDEWSFPYSNDNNSLGFTYRNSSDHVKFLLDLPMVTEPGSTYAYSTIASVALGAAVENSTGIQLKDYADQYLFEPLGITTHRWDFTPVGRLHTGGGLWLGGRDMLKFGQLYLNNGLWNGQRIISENWVEQSFQRRVNFNYGHSDGYGYQWWRKDFSISGKGIIQAYFTAGNGGQFIYVIPTLDAVIAFTGGNYDSLLMYQADTLMQQYVLPAFD